ncbi:AEC family transporter [Terrarubrum flagellatum]|uniref:AEC family transporter n=1 Tax=Terrirubrum flagellatum TaxID=2895980 RepID=UPI00314567A2
MSELTPLLNLILPYFSIIALGFLIGKWKALPESGLVWMNFFIIYVALPPLFFRLLADKPLEQLANWRFVSMTMLATYCTFAISFAYGVWQTKGNLPEAIMQGVAGAYANVGYMGPPLVLEALGQGASGAVALVFVTDVLLLFAMIPLLMALAGAGDRGFFATIGSVIRNILTHPFNIAAAAGVAASWFQLQIPVWLDKTTAWLSSASAPGALFVLGVTVALRAKAGFPREAPALVFIKLVIHPLMVWLLLSVFGDFDPLWVYAAVLMAALPPALTSFVFATQYKVGLDRASACIMLGTACSLLTLTGLLWLIRTGRMPADLFPM